jgi:hypothetical protein
VVSGPATIVGGQGTNTVTLQQTGNGIAVLRATAGDYFDERNIQMGLKLPYYNIYAPSGSCAGDFFEAIAVSNNGSPVTYNWYINGNLQGVTNYKLRSYFPTNGTHIGLTVTKAGCGTSDEYYQTETVSLRSLQIRLPQNLQWSRRLAGALQQSEYWIRWVMQELNTNIQRTQERQQCPLAVYLRMFIPSRCGMDRNGSRNCS